MNTKVLEHSGGMPGDDSGFSVDTTFVLFFLAIEFGRTLMSLEFDGVLLGVSLAVLLVVPYFLGMNDRPAFGKWLAGRSVIAAFATALGMAFQTTLGIVIPEEFRFLPMTLLIGAAILSCYVQFYGFMKFRVAK